MCYASVSYSRLNQDLPDKLSFNSWTPVVHVHKMVLNGRWHRGQSTSRRRLRLGGDKRDARQQKKRLLQLTGAHLVEARSGGELRQTGNDSRKLGKHRVSVHGCVGARLLQWNPSARCVGPCAFVGHKRHCTDCGVTLSDNTFPLVSLIIFVSDLCLLTWC